jgi:tartrate dehydrogenase/decarboxylase/D-malate dehydrogenase
VPGPGAAPHRAGPAISTPPATLLGAALMLHHRGPGAAPRRLEAAVGRVYRDGNTLTPDQGGSASTHAMARAVLAAYRNA